MKDTLTISGLLLQECLSTSNWNERPKIKVTKEEEMNSGQAIDMYLEIKKRGYREE